MHCVFPLHPAFTPHWHCPSAEHESDREGSHPPQTPPFEPHAETEGVTHAPFWQHPFGQVVGPQPEQTPPWQVEPFPHVEHVDPLEPQAPGSVPAWQPAALQQPFGHEDASQTHWPFAHRSPATQG